METKICAKCGIELPKTNKYFNIVKVNKDGFRSYCKKCESEYKKQYRKKNKEIIYEQKKQYYKENKEVINKYMKIYYIKNKKIIDEYMKQYRETHKTDRKKYREYMKQYYESHKEIIDEYMKQYRETHKENLIKYRKENIEKMRIFIQRRKSKERQLPATLTTEQWEQIKHHFNNKCAYCGKEKPLEQEHFVAVSKGGEYTINNIIPACKSCNCSKNNKEFFKWYPKYKYYSKERETDILEFLGYKDNQQQLPLIK